VHLKSIELFGFKSFAERTRIELTRGTCALLGPNGCGKSNVVDAVKWVFGEQSSRSLRAERMEDVIFGGSEGTKATSAAEVAVTLTSETEDLPLGVSELEVRRRLYRSGESLYYINNQPAKLREVRELFYDTGMGKSAYSIMEQGRIDQVLSTRPEDRRSLFEEAAGITKYRVQGAEAERKLERTEENMKQAELLLSEVRRSHDTLKRQAEQTEKYRAYREEIFRLELDIQLLKLRRLLEDRHSREKALETQGQERAALEGEITALKTSSDAHMGEINSMESRLNDAQKRLYAIEMERGRSDGEIRLLQDRMAELAGQIADEDAKAVKVEAKIAQIVADFDSRQASASDLGTRIDDVERNIEEFRRDIEGFSQRIVANDHTVRGIRGEVAELDAGLEGLRDELRGITDDIVTQLDQRLKDSGYSYREGKKLEAAMDEIVAGMRIVLRGRAEILEDALGLGDVSAEDARKIMGSSLEASRSLSERVEELARMLATYRTLLPSFLDEFLAPEGIITHKRAIDGRISESLSAVSRLRAREAELAAENVELAKKIEQYRSTLEELRVSRARMRSQQESLRAEVERLAAEAKEQTAALEQSRRRTEESRKRVSELGASVERARERIAALTVEDAELRKSLSKLEKGIAERNRTLRSTEEKLRQRAGALERMHGKDEQVRVDLATINTEIRDVHENFAERFSRDLSEFESGMYEIQADPERLKAALKDLRDKQRDLGHVNLMAPEEFAEVKERFDFLTGQIADLHKAREDLKTVTEEIRTESTKRFLETYNLIRRNFHVMFRRLFEGGRADLKLTDPENVLESGVDIIAQPPGKKPENISLLSGGERSLTAIALLFGTYMVKPSPFCILDEIDAALSEDNVTRFTTLLREFSKTSQFIIITHNKKTVMAADALYGITMEESGVSKLIAIRLDTGEKTQAPSAPAASAPAPAAPTPSAS
jgi:chromosome segregation protein